MCYVGRYRPTSLPGSDAGEIAFKQLLDSADAGFSGAINANAPSAIESAASVPVSGKLLWRKPDVAHAALSGAYVSTRHSSRSLWFKMAIPPIVAVTLSAQADVKADAVASRSGPIVMTARPTTSSSIMAVARLAISLVQSRL